MKFITNQESHVPGVNKSVMNRFDRGEVHKSEIHKGEIYKGVAGTNQTLQVWLAGTVKKPKGVFVQQEKSQPFVETFIKTIVPESQRNLIFCRFGFNLVDNLILLLFLSYILDHYNIYKVLAKK